MLIDHMTGFRPIPVLAAYGDGRPVRAFGTEEMRVIVPAESNGGGFAIWEHASQPGFGPPRHIHHREDEIFHVLDGKLLIWCNGDTYEAVPGMFASLPRGLPHTFRVISDTPARLLMTVVPGGFERFFAAVSHLEVPRDMERLAAISGSYGVDLIGPPLAG